MYLLCLRKKGFFCTTDSQHDREIHTDLTKELVLTGPNQLRVADITYIRLLDEFVFLAVILDAYSRKCIGWELNRHLEVSLTLGALNHALGTRSINIGSFLPISINSSLMKMNERRKKRELQKVKENRQKNKHKS